MSSWPPVLSLQSLNCSCQGQFSSVRYSELNLFHSLQIHTHVPNIANYLQQNKTKNADAKNLYPDTCGSFSHNHLKLETILFLNQRKDEQTVVYPHSRIVLSKKKNQESIHNAVRTHCGCILPSEDAILGASWENSNNMARKEQNCRETDCGCQGLRWGRGGLKGAARSAA